MVTHALFRPTNGAGRFLQASTAAPFQGLKSRNTHNKSTEGALLAGADETSFWTELWARGTPGVGKEAQH